MEEYDLALNISPIDSETPNNNLQDDMLVLKNLRVSYPNNINSIRSKFEMLSLSVTQYVDIIRNLELGSNFKVRQYFPVNPIFNKWVFYSS